MWPAGQDAAHRRGRRRQDPVRGVYDDSEEARLTAEDIDRLRREGVALNHMAILVRASFQMRAFEDRFVTMGMPYRVIGGPRFYERQEIKDAIAYLEVMQNPAADLKFERIVNVPKRGLGDQTVQAVFQLARGEGLSLFDAARDYGNRGAEARRPQIAARAHRGFRPLAQPCRRHAAHRPRRADPRRERLHRDVAEG